jgi:hypothetical protein
LVDFLLVHVTLQYILAYPTDTPFTVPLLDTIATFLLDVDHFILATFTLGLAFFIDNLYNCPLYSTFPVLDIVILVVLGVAADASATGITVITIIIAKITILAICLEYFIVFFNNSSLV